MKTNLLRFIFPTLILIVVLAACGKEKTNTLPPRPLNLTVYLDLSNRLVVTPDREKKDYVQKERDLAIVDLLADAFVQHSRDSFQYIHSRDIFEIIAYPAPAGSDVDTLLAKLKTDCPSFGQNFSVRKLRLLTMKDSIHHTLEQIYDRTIAQQQWIGSDIWGFFSRDAVRDRCVREGYRNVLVVITDGYIDHKHNRINEGNAYSYIWNETLADPNTSLIVRNKDLDGLEVLFMELERHPGKPEYGDRLHNVIGTWLEAMGVKRYKLIDTDKPSNLPRYIELFMKEQ